jgi:hypothetical protein
MVDKEIEFTNIIRSMLVKQNASYSLDGYAFVCGKKWNTGLKIYKGIPIYYFNDVLMKDTIQLIPSPYPNETKEM